MSAVTDTIGNSVDTEQPFSTPDRITAQPKLARFQFRVSNRWIDGSPNRSAIKNSYATGGENSTRSQEFVIDAGEPAIRLGTPTQTHASGGLDDTATQQPHRQAQTGRARLSRRATPAGQRSAPTPPGIGAALGRQTRRQPIRDAGAGDAARVHMSAAYPTPGGAGRQKLDDQAEKMDDRGLVSEQPRPAAPHAGPPAGAPGYPPLCAHGMNSLTDRRYDLALARLRRR